MISDLPPKIWLPAKPAIIRPAPIQKAGFLPGMFPGLMMATSAAAAPLTTLSFITSVTNNGTSVTAMADIQSGDLLVWYDYALYASPVVPTSFTQIGATQSSAYIDSIVAYKIADGSESSSTITGMNGAYSISYKFLLQFRGDVAITSIAVQDVAQQITDGNPTAQTCNASGGVSPLVVIATYGSSSDIIPRTFSPAADGELNVTTASYLKYKIYNSSPQDISIDMDDEDVDNVLQSFFLEAA